MVAGQEEVGSVMLPLKPGDQIFRNGAFGLESLCHHGIYIGKFVLAPDSTEEKPKLLWDEGSPEAVVDVSGSPRDGCFIRRVALAEFLDDGARTRARAGSAGSASSA